VLAYTGDHRCLRWAEGPLSQRNFGFGGFGLCRRSRCGPGIHLSGSRAAQAAVDAGGVQRLMLTHMPRGTTLQYAEPAEAVWPGEVELAEADAVYEL